jgi:3-hydroxyacyl-CoA dehydrogenase
MSPPSADRAVRATPGPAAVAVVGTGVIGRSWIRVFARAGLPVRAWDPDRTTLDNAVDWAAQEAVREGDSPDAPSRVTACVTLADALGGAAFVQESGPERLALKREIFAELDRLADGDAILASSTSAIDITEITSGLAGARRCIVAHPVNPPHVIPVVEVLAGKETSAETVLATTEMLRSVGQTPVVLNFYVRGFLLNRMQTALVREAVDLFRRGVASADDIDATIRDGLGLRWALMGPFGVANTNADGGSREYFTRYGDAFTALAADLTTEMHLDAEVVGRLGEATAAMERGVDRADIRAWRDRLVRQLTQLKRENPLSPAP